MRLHYFAAVALIVLLAAAAALARPSDDEIQRRQAAGAFSSCAPADRPGLGDHRDGVCGKSGAVTVARPAKKPASNLPWSEST